MDVKNDKEGKEILRASDGDIDENVEHPSSISDEDLGYCTPDLNCDFKDNDLIKFLSLMIAEGTHRCPADIKKLPFYDYTPQFLNSQYSAEYDQQQYTYFFTERPLWNLAAKQGYWHPFNCHVRVDDVTVFNQKEHGFYQEMRYYEGSHPGEETSWVMFEYNQNWKFKPKKINVPVICKLKKPDADKDIDGHLENSQSYEDQELIAFLREKESNSDYSKDFIHQANDLWETEDLSFLYYSNKRANVGVSYFFVYRGRRTLTNKDGYWDLVKFSIPIKNIEGQKIGFYDLLQYYRGGKNKGKEAEPDWILYDYRLTEHQNVTRDSKGWFLSKLLKGSNSRQIPSNEHMVPDDRRLQLLIDAANLNP